jgi:hypothetical protein
MSEHLTHTYYMLTWPSREELRVSTLFMLSDIAVVDHTLIFPSANAICGDVMAHGGWEDLEDAWKDGITCPRTMYFYNMLEKLQILQVAISLVVTSDMDIE